LYLNRDYKESAIYFRKSLKYVKDRKLEAQAHFWLGQIAFHENRYSECIQEQLAFLNSSASNQSKEQPYALYSIGYAYYKLSDFRTASLYFSKYKKENKHSIANHDLYIDNTLRLADCYFLARDYPNAIKQYGEVISLDYKSADYAL
jgi:TolA-binding protein